MIVESMNFQQRVDSAVHRSPHLMGRRLLVAANEGRVTLQGVVSSYYQKQMAQETIRRLDGVECIDNRLEVATP
jgi:osmotically-inducible protein OsmY